MARRPAGSAGHPVIQTPTLDHLARLGTRYPRAYAECPICIPARRSVMTGTSPRGHGDRNFAPALPMPALPTLAQRFRDGGYQAYAVGKMHLYPQRDASASTTSCWPRKAARSWARWTTTTCTWPNRARRASSTCTA